MDQRAVPFGHCRFPATENLKKFRRNGVWNKAKKPFTTGTDCEPPAMDNRKVCHDPRPRKEYRPSKISEDKVVIVNVSVQKEPRRLCFGKFKSLRCLIYMQNIVQMVRYYHRCLVVKAVIKLQQWMTTKLGTTPTREGETCGDVSTLEHSLTSPKFFFS
ncbi:hypothetical protein F2Q69_00020028 [Brassica cretica]|uniref:Uncharacterized protein n=1 Tax=Brassica cretica TaxID=69181 RepID=A0A8S9QEJ9_BRACR|nr:hypothetical protein F2Q69_00020028 [Brassica cretica]